MSPCCNFNSGPQFYVFVGVMAFLYSMATLVLYVFFDDKWRNIEMIPIVVNTAFALASQFQRFLYIGCFSKISNKFHVFKIRLTLLLQDCIAAVVFAVLFLIGSSVWADSLTDIKHYSDPDELFNRIVKDCTDSYNHTCKTSHTGNFATLNVSVVSLF